MQKVIDDVAENKFITVWLELFNQTMADLQSYFELAYQSQDLGKLIFDNNLASIAKIISRDLFIKTYWQIFEEQKKNGTIDAHLYILYSIFGTDSTIVVQNENPLHVKFYILTKAITLNQWVTRSGDNVITRSGDNIVFRQVVQDLTNAELASLLKATANYGEYIEFEIDTNANFNDYGNVTQWIGLREDYGYVTQPVGLSADYGFVTQPTE